MTSVHGILWIYSGGAVSWDVGIVVEGKKPEHKKQQELSDLDWLFCGYERMEAAVV